MYQGIRCQKTIHYFHTPKLYSVVHIHTSRYAAVIASAACIYIYIYIYIHIYISELKSPQAALPTLRAQIKRVILYDDDGIHYSLEWKE